MPNDRLHALSDGIFAIAMTLLVFDVRVPVLSVANNHIILAALRQLLPVFLSLVLSFAILYTYWQGHNVVISHLAKNIDFRLSNANALFLFFVVLIPFSSDFLGRYHTSEIGIILYGANVIALATTLLLMRKYIIRAKHIENREWSQRDLTDMFIRIAFPAVCAVAAIFCGLLNKNISLGLFTLGVLFNFTQTSTLLIGKLLD